ncbi:hypothetical protein A5N78_04620 [Prescottella equi]|uniref:hypothetical protein n=1 Tax=Rhodococcus hoagii TaxID=43767 RepID=UPI000A1208EC|nr:hypothetical protein [Prescottella equi]ORL93424.1 hypothetical protein A5N78_04620 [Prescottella equi]ORM17777.1 hypothetical protein A5N70_11195 [Prescottella equi]
MTDTITPEEYEIAAKVADAEGDYELRDILRSRAAHRRAESACDEEAERYAKVYRRAQRRVYPTLAKWGSLDAETQENYTRPMRAVLDRLAADGRLLPEGGTVLTEEQAEDVRWLFGLLSDMSFTADRENESYKRLVALFPPPAVSVPDSEPEDPCGGTGTVECWNPGGLCTEKVCELCGPCRTCDPNAPILFANSGPDGTPEKPWPNLHEVPASVRKVSDAFGCHWERRPESGWNRCVGAPQCDAGHPESAPFVRVDGDEA